MLCKQRPNCRYQFKGNFHSCLCLIRKSCFIFGNRFFFALFFVKSKQSLHSFLIPIARKTRVALVQNSMIHIANTV